MRVGFTAMGAASAVLLLLGSAQAQTNVPDTDMSAVSGNAGFYFPKDIFETGATLEGTYEYYFSPRVGIRTGLGWTDPNFEESGDSLRQIRWTVDLLYNWERGKWHPYVGAGFGAYFLQHKFSGRSTGDSETQPGLNIGGGVKYFTSRTLTVKGEAFYHAIAQGDLPWSPSGLALMGGIKKYF